MGYGTMNYINAMRELLVMKPVDGVATSEALCARLVGDATGGVVLHRLLQWMPKSRRKDGAIWKSDAEMTAETGFSAKQLRRVRALDGFIALIESWCGKAKGAPTMHYKVAPGFFAALGRVFGMSSAMVRGMVGIQGQMESAQTAQSITTESPTLLEEENIPISESESFVMENAKTKTEALLIENGVNETLAATWRDVDLGVVQAYLNLAQDGKASGKIKKVAGYLVGCLRSYVSTQVGPVEEDTDKYDLLKLAKEGFEGYVVNQLRQEANWRTLNSEEQAFLAGYEAKWSSQMEWMTA